MEPVLLSVTPAGLARLIKKCAFEMNAHDKAEIARAEEEGTAAKIGTEGQRICEETARGMGLEPYSFPVYLLLTHAWNDILDWADENAG